MKRLFVLILVTLLLLAGLTATAQIQRGSKKQETKPKTEQTKKKKGTTEQQTKGNSSKKDNTPSTPKVEWFTANGVTFEMVYVEGGTFTMGSNEGESEEKPTHQVTLSGFYISKYEVTQELWQAVMCENPSEFKGDSRRPVEMVSWNDCQEFIYKLNKLTGKRFRLPTEAQWEYAARGGKKSKGYKYSGSNDIDKVAWYKDNSDSTPHPVGQKSPNELGLYDMSGNVWEWCQDWFDCFTYTKSSKRNPTGPFSGDNHVIRGGCMIGWSGDAEHCRVSQRFYNSPYARSSTLGLRLAL